MAVLHFDLYSGNSLSNMFCIILKWMSFFLLAGRRGGGIISYKIDFECIKYSDHESKQPAWMWDAVFGIIYRKICVCSVLDKHPFNSSLQRDVTWYMYFLNKGPSPGNRTRDITQTYGLKNYFDRHLVHCIWFILEGGVDSDNALQCWINKTCRFWNNVTIA